MQAYTFRQATLADRPAIIQFMNTHWGEKHPIINLPDFFDYYYLADDNTLRFALAEADGKLAALAGFVPASQALKPDIWVSIWVADKKQSGAGLELMAALPTLTGSGTLACNNIRPKTRPFYEFLGYTTGRVGHFYRLANRTTYVVAHIAHKHILPVSGVATLQPLPTVQALQASGFTPPQNHNPYKDFWYLARRYYAYPRQQYNVLGGYLPGQATPAALLVTRTVPVQGTHALRIVDYIGEADFLPQLGSAIDALIAGQNAEYADLYCAGIPAKTLQEAGFCERTEDDANIIPNYLTPLLQKNIEYYYFTNNPQNFTMFRADGDQDRPNIPVP
ncbi:hypothetical protein LJC61_02060 [Ruminococcaceae bacterium OttesenSCG-928-A16]|nr:hypothetical protein [Ruminococcaceae bacterium OttesenSCG-928-A16]